MLVCLRKWKSQRAYLQALSFPNSRPPVRYGSTLQPAAPNTAWFSRPLTKRFTCFSQYTDTLDKDGIAQRPMAMQSFTRPITSVLMFPKVHCLVSTEEGQHVPSRRLGLRAVERSYRSEGNGNCGNVGQHKSWKRCHLGFVFDAEVIVKVDSNSNYIRSGVFSDEGFLEERFERLLPDCKQIDGRWIWLRNISKVA